MEWVVRTNIELDDDVVAELMRRTGLRTKKSVVDEALQLMLAIERQKDVLELRGVWKDDREASARALDEDDDEDELGRDRDAER
jgi:Arc/MetJ family transcription regulator